MRSIAGFCQPCGSSLTLHRLGIKVADVKVRLALISGSLHQVVKTIKSVAADIGF